MPGSLKFYHLSHDFSEFCGHVEKKFNINALSDLDDKIYRIYIRAWKKGPESIPNDYKKELVYAVYERSKIAAHKLYNIVARNLRDKNHKLKNDIFKFIALLKSMIMKYKIYRKTNTVEFIGDLFDWYPRFAMRAMKKSNVYSRYKKPISDLVGYITILLKNVHRALREKIEK